MHMLWNTTRRSLREFRFREKTRIILLAAGSFGWPVVSHNSTSARAQSWISAAAQDPPYRFCSKSSSWTRYWVWMHLSNRWRVNSHYTEVPDHGLYSRLYISAQNFF